MRCGFTGRSAPTNGCSTAQDSPNLHGSRGFGRGLIFAADGTLVASVAQEGLMRERQARAQTGLICPGRGLLPAGKAINPLNL